MRPVFLAAACACLMSGIAQARRDSGSTRQWSPAVVTAGGSIGVRSVPDISESQATATGFVGLGVRLHDLGGVTAEYRRAALRSGEHFAFYLATAEFYPAYRAGWQGLRVSAGLGRASIRAQPFGGGHGSERLEGNTMAWAVGIAHDVRARYFVLTSYAGMVTASAGGLRTTSCSTPNYLNGDFSQVCFDRRGPSFGIVQIGLAIGVR
jgi:hypothetical protein